MHLEDQGDLPWQIGIPPKLPSSSSTGLPGPRAASSPASRAGLMRNLGGEQKCTVVEVPSKPDGDPRSNSVDY